MLAFRKADASVFSVTSRRGKLILGSPDGREPCTFERRFAVLESMSKGGHDPWLKDIKLPQHEGSFVPRILVCFVAYFASCSLLF